MKLTFNEFDLCLFMNKILKIIKSFIPKSDKLRHISILKKAKTKKLLNRY